MGCNNSQFEFQIGGSAIMPISVRDVDGNLVDADATPVVTWMTVNGAGVDETAVIYGVSVVQVQDDTPAAITGEYQLSFDASQFTPGDVVEFGVQAQVNGVTLNTRKSAKIKDDPNERPTLC